MECYKCSLHHFLPIEQAGSSREGLVTAANQILRYGKLRSDLHNWQAFFSLLCAFCTDFGAMTSYAKQISLGNWLDRQSDDVHVAHDFSLKLISWKSVTDLTNLFLMFLLYVSPTPCIETVNYAMGTGIIPRHNKLVLIVSITELALILRLNVLCFIVQNLLYRLPSYCDFICEHLLYCSYPNAKSNIFRIL